MYDLVLSYILPNMEEPNTAPEGGESTEETPAAPEVEKKEGDEEASSDA